ncbi:hypothetical protein MMC24_007319 [Lignoscripta atroalba]|nr:hypothetical protein [Lignoscripta atroalba]
MPIAASTVEGSPAESLVDRRASCPQSYAVVARNARGYGIQQVLLETLANTKATRSIRQFSYEVPIDQFPVQPLFSRLQVTPDGLSVAARFEDGPDGDSNWQPNGKRQASDDSFESSTIVALSQSGCG